MSLWDRVNTIIAYGVSLLLIIAMLIFSVDYASFDAGFYRKQYKEHKVSEEIGMSEEDLLRANTTLLQYLKGEKETIEVSVSVKGKRQQAFNSKESAHMVDVKRLYETIKQLQKLCIVFVIVGCLLLFVRLRKGAYTLLCINYIKTAFVFAMLVCFILGFAYVDFDRFWFGFHELFFTNDLWLLDPTTDLMIHMFPAPLFSALVFKIATYFISGFALVFIGSYLYLRIRLNRIAKEEDICE